MGAGKTTLIKKLLKEALNGTKVVLIENEFGEIGIDGGFLKEAGIEITEMKELMLDIMSSIDKYCRENGLRYSLAYGTLIGAIRHQGYIPWDDDIDIWMPRPDYMRFMQEYKHEYYKAYCAELTPGWDRFIAKVCDERTVIDEGHGEVCGVYVDIFPIDGWPEGEKGIKKH